MSTREIFMEAVGSIISLNAQSASSARTIKAGKDFEAVLINAVFGELQTAFTNLPGKPLSNSTKTYDGIAMQALASGLSRGPGIGLGAFVSRWLESRKPALGSRL
jgi:Rod binding domain-containing protein